MEWQKLGLVWGPSGTQGWARSHAMLPTPIQLEDRLRVYVTCCDLDGVGRIGYVDLDTGDPTQVLGFSSYPVFDIGDSGAFDDNGVAACSVVRLPDDRLFMYYVGFELCHHIRYRLLTGLAISEDGGETFRRVSRVPILERTDEERHFRCGPFVMREDNRFRMWYVAGSEWTQVGDKSLPVYDIRYIESSDGVHWPAKGHSILRVTEPNEHGFGRPWLHRRALGASSLHFSVRSRSTGQYRLALASLGNQGTWERRDDELNLDIGKFGFDDRAIMYSAVIECNGGTYCLYNGNDFGREGFGAALLSSA